MAKTHKEIPPLVQAYDYSVVREYKKRYGGAIFAVERTVRTDVLEDDLVLDIQSDREFTKIFLNGAEQEIAPKNKKK